MLASPVRSRWTVIVGRLVVQIILGTVYAFSVFVRPLEEQLGWSRASTQWAFSVALAAFALVMIPAGRLQDRIGPRKVASIGGLLLGVSLLLGALLVAPDRGWALYLTYGVVAGAGVLLGAALLRNPPEGWKPAGWTAPADAAAHGEIGWRDLLNRPLACMLWMTFIFGATSGLLAIGQWMPMMGIVLDGRTFAPEWLGSFGRFVEPVGILAVFSAIGRIFWGRVSDTIDRPRAMMLMFLGQGLAFMILAGIESPLAVFLASAWVGLNFGGNFALFPSATADYFGTKNFGVNYGLVFTAHGVAGILGPVVGGVLYDVTRDYVIAFVFAGVLCFLAAASAVVAWALSRRPVEYRASHA